MSEALRHHAELLRVAATDPGTNQLGLVVMDIMENGNIVIVHVETLEGVKLAREFPGIIDTHGEKFAKLYGIEKHLERVFKEYEPQLIVSESPYMGRFPAAFAALVECLGTIRKAVFRYCRTLPLRLLDPASVKQGMLVSGKSGDKSLMLAALVKLGDRITFADPITLADLDEHTIDAICVGLVQCHLLKLLTLR